MTELPRPLLYQNDRFFTLFTDRNRAGWFGAFMLPGGSQLTRLNTTWCFALEPFQDTSDSNQTNCKTMRTKFKCFTCAFGRVRRTRTIRNVVAVVTKSTETLDPSWGCKSRRQSSGVVHPEEKKNETEKETNPPFIFRTTHISKNRISIFIH